MTHYGIRCAGFADGKQSAPVGAWLAAYRPEAYGGRGWADWSYDSTLAMRFDHIDDAFACWHSVPINRPRRGDGKPNKPLTAFHVAIEPLP